MTWVFVVLVVLVLGAAVVVSAGRGAGMKPAFDDRPDVVVPADRPLRATDLDRVRFTTAVRGYRMDEVDALLARLRSELEERADGSGPAEDRGDPHAG